MTNICKICLFTNIKTYVITNTDLQELYETLTKIKIHSKDTYQSVCYLCHMQMKQCLKLKQQAIQTDRLLKEALENNIEIKTPTTFRLTTSHLITLNIDPDQAKVEVKDENIKTENEDISTDMYTSDLDLETIKENNPNIKESRSDSEDDIPLKNISSKMLGKSDIGMKSIKRKRDRKINAKEILLSTEEQIQEMTDRSKSENYLNSPYKCDLCYKGFVEPVAFEKHKDKHDKISGPYKCDICHLRYLSSKSLRAHSAATHARRYQCADCTHRAHTRNQAIEHEKWHKGHTYSCQLCGLKFSKPSTHLTHMRKRHAGAHVCRLCGDSFYGPRGLHMHLSKAHRRDEPNSNPPADCVCKDCDIQFSNKDAFTRHLLITNKHTLFDDDSHCKVCDTQTTNQSAHERMHARLLKRSGDTSRRTVSDFRVSCQQCEANFSSRSRLQNHIKRVHLGIKYNKDIVCETCGKKCTSAAALQVHQRRHTGERPFPCGRCPARFSRREYLRVHGRSHSGERPYACKLCGHAFTQKPALNRHYRVHTGARPYACHLCAKTFSQSNSLKIHIDTVHLKMPKTKKNKHDSDIDKPLS